MPAAQKLSCGHALICHWMGSVAHRGQSVQPFFSVHYIVGVSDSDFSLVLTNEDALIHV